METLADNAPSCLECHGTGVKPCRSAAEIHMSELATFCCCAHGQLRWAATLQRLSRADRDAPSRKGTASISMDP
jgi:hypothetical protein